MELSVFTYWKTSKINMPHEIASRFKEIIFIKFDNKVYIEATILGLGGGNKIYMPYDVLMKHRVIKPYYELSRKAIGKPNLDPKYFSCEDPEKCLMKTNDMFVDTIYIVEDFVKNTIEAKKGNSYQRFDLEKMKNADVATDVEIEDFDTIFKEKYMYDHDEDKEYSDFEKRIATYAALVDKL
jgi:hypothetical protein